MHPCLIFLQAEDVRSLLQDAMPNHQQAATPARPLVPSLTPIPTPNPAG